MEVTVGALLCALLTSGADQEKHDFLSNDDEWSIRVDCATDTHVIEFGYDNKADSRDSVHQAIFSSILTGKTPMVIIIDTDNREDRYQFEIRVVANKLGIPFGVCSEGFIYRWAATAPYRDLSLDKRLDEFEIPAGVRPYCNLAGVFNPPGDE